MKLGFGKFVLDRRAGRLLGPLGEVPLRPQAFRMLEVLAEQAPKILSQEELLDRVWGVEHLSPASVKQAISEVRQALGDDPAWPTLIETVHRRGYRFIASVERIEDAPAPAKKSGLETQPISIPAAALVRRPPPEAKLPLAATPARASARPATEKKDSLRIQVLVEDVRTGETVTWARETGALEELIDLATAAARGIQGTMAREKIGPPSVGPAGRNER